MKKMNKLAIFMALAMLSVSALADEEPQQKFYIAPEIGSVTYNDYCKNIRDSFVQTATCSDSEIGFGLFGGYQFNDFIAAEAGFFIANGFDVSATVSSVDIKFDIDYESFLLGGAWRYPLGERFAITGRVGYHFWDADANASAGSVTASVSDDGTDLYFGGGIEFVGVNNISFRAEYTRYELADGDADVLGGRWIISF